MRRLVLLTSIVAVGLLSISPGPEPVSADHLTGESYCVASISYANLNRKVFGAVEAECGSVHSAPWGNWGVDSNSGNKQDSTQFNGWKSKEGKRQWNSCTTDSPWTPGNCNFYNASSCTQQKTSTGEHTYGSFRIYTDIGETCTDGFHNNVISSSGNFMKLYELDPWSPDQFVTRLNYPTIKVTGSCSGTGEDNECSGSGSKYSPSSVSPNVAFAKIRLNLYAWMETIQ